jgi:hypothetical protein
MKITTLAALFCFCGSLAVGQERDVNDFPRPEFRGMTQKQVTNLIFSQENRMIDKLSSLRPVTEAYVQSLGQQKSMGMDLSASENSESVIDDVYFLAKVNFTDDGPEEKLLVGGGSWRNKYIKINSGALDQVHPLGMLMMFFADLYEFDADTYSLQYQGKQNLLRTECLIFSVAPIQEHNSGKFRGQLWVDSSSFSIVRLKGVFSGPYKRFLKTFSGPERFFHFDSVREKTEFGWLPSSTYFDERHVYARDGDLEFHYRGYALMWEQGRQLQNTQFSIPNSAKILSGQQNARIRRPASGAGPGGAPSRRHCGAPSTARVSRDTRNPLSSASEHSSRGLRAGKYNHRQSRFAESRSGRLCSSVPAGPPTGAHTVAPWDRCAAAISPKLLRRRGKKAFCPAYDPFATGTGGCG